MNAFIGERHVDKLLLYLNEGCHSLLGLGSQTSLSLGSQENMDDIQELDASFLGNVTLIGEPVRNDSNRGSSDDEEEDLEEEVSQDVSESMHGVLLPLPQRPHSILRDEHTISASAFLLQCENCHHAFVSFSLSLNWLVLHAVC